MGLAAVAAMEITSIAPSAARACSPTFDDGCESNVEVFVGVTERPTNACIRASWSLPNPDETFDPGDAGADGGDVGPFSAGTSDFVYVAPDGSTIALLAGTMRCPERELAPFTEYAIVGPSACGRGEPFEYARFTTTAGPDTTPPTQPGPVSSSCWTESCDSSACCGPYVIRVVSSSWAASTDDGGAVLYDAGGVFTPLTSQRGFAVMSGVVMGGTVVGSGGMTGRLGAGASGLIAYDMAGNEPAEIGVSYPCMDPGDETAATCSSRGRTEARLPVVLSLLASLGVIARRRRR